VALADKLDSIVVFLHEGLRPTGSSDPYALRRAGLGVLRILITAQVRLEVGDAVFAVLSKYLGIKTGSKIADEVYQVQAAADQLGLSLDEEALENLVSDAAKGEDSVRVRFVEPAQATAREVVAFLADRLKVQQREAGIRPDIIDAVFALGGEDDLVRLLARVRALQAFIDTEDGANLLAGYKRAANILRIEEAKDGPHDGAVDDARLTDPGEQALASALASALPAASTAVANEDFTAAMIALAQLRTPVDRFFTDVIVNAEDPAIRVNRLSLLNMLRTAVHAVADFGRIDK
jgi:glycyl-tRNA synthetase beta chain